MPRRPKIDLGRPPTVAFRDQRRGNDGRDNCATSGHRFPERSGQSMARQSNASTPMRPRFFWLETAHTRSSARCAFHSSIFPRSQNAKPPAKRKSRSIAPIAPAIYRGVVAITREPNGRLAIGGRGEPVEWAVEMRRFDEIQTLDRLAEARGNRRGARRSARPRGGGCAPRRAPASRNAAFTETLAEIIAQNEAELARSNRSCFRCRTVRALGAATRDALERVKPLLQARERAGLGAAMPWRSASRQYRAHRRQAGVVRRHRIRRPHRNRRRALRSRLSADGSDRARTAARLPTSYSIAI